jgi:hypothetical protein
MTEYSLEQRVRHLEEKLEFREKLIAEESALEPRKWGRDQALLSIVQELAERLGISEEQFDAAYEERSAYFLDQVLLGIEQKHPRVAAEWDRRELDELPAGRFQPLPFPEDD